MKMDTYSNMTEFDASSQTFKVSRGNETEVESLTARIARRVHALRTGQRMSLETLAARSGVSRSMISLIERNEASPTAVVLERLATGLNVVLAALF